MKLARKIAASLAVLVMVLLGLFAQLSVTREISLLETDTRRDHLLMGRALAAAVAAVWPQGGEASAVDLLGRAHNGEHQIHLRWLWLDSPEGSALSPHVRAALARDEEAFEDRSDGGALVTYIPLRPRGQAVGAIELSEPRTEERRYVRATIERFALITAAMALACGAFTLGLGIWFVGRPMRLLVEQARRVGAGDFSWRLTLRQHDEIADLATAMNVMCEELAQARSSVAAETARRIATLEQLRHADRLTTVGKLASGVAHELGTPLNVVHGRAALIADEPDASPDVVRCARIIMDQAERMTSIIRQLLDFARRREPKKELSDIPDVVGRALGLVTPMADKRRVTMDVSKDPRQDLRARVDRALLEQVLMNLVVNGIQSMPEGGALRVKVGVERATPPADHGDPPGEYLCIAVDDEGCGIAPSVIEHIFEPFFTTKDVGEGTGLGLSVSYGIVQDHGGWIAVDSAVGKGSSFRVYLPRGDEGEGRPA